MSGLLGILLPLLLIAGGVVSIVYLRPMMLGHVREMKYIHTTSIKELLDMYQTMADSGLGDTFRNYIELKGTVECDQPTVTPFSSQSVAYCSSKLSAVSQREEQYRDNDGHYHTRTVKEEQVLSSENSAEVLFMRDGSSDTRVALDINNGCSFDVPETFDRFETVGNLGRYAYFRNFRHPRANLLGYRMQEKTIPLGQPLYVLGEAYMEGTTLHIGKPIDKEKSFIVSTKSEDQLVGKYEGNAKVAFFGGIGAVVVGVLLLISHFL